VESRLRTQRRRSAPACAPRCLSKDAPACAQENLR
jgi:hypothetical protein